MVYRHRRARETTLELVDLVDLPREDRAADWNYTMQTRLFEFFVSLHSAFESSFYALYFAGSRLARKDFPYAGIPTTYSRIKGGPTTNAFETAWPNDPLATAMWDLLADAVHKDLADVRNVLAHRIAPGFGHRITLSDTVNVGGAGTPQNGESEYELAWRGQALATRIPSTLQNAEEALAALWEAAADFFARQPA
jgi:hypothetical protein